MLVPNFADVIRVTRTDIEKGEAKERDKKKDVTRLKVKNLGTVLKQKGFSQKIPFEMRPKN